jgi:hypothetical protein
VPDEAVQWYVSAEGPASRSLAEIVRAIDVPVGGVELTESTVGQTLIVPLRRRCPSCPPS